MSPHRRPMSTLHNDPRMTRGPSALHDADLVKVTLSDGLTVEVLVHKSTPSLSWAVTYFDDGHVVLRIVDSEGHIYAETRQ